MGQNTSVPSRGRRRSLRTFRSPFPRRSTSHQSNLSATFAISENDQKIEQLNVNLASEEELMTLPGITRPIAQSIVEHRRAIGRFKKVEDLALVSGIGAERLDKIRPEICVSKRSCASSRAQSMDSLKSTDSTRLAHKGPSSHAAKIVDVNRANVFDLQCISGISQELAANIVHYRDKKGPFNSLDGLLKVKGMDAIRLGSLRCQLTVKEKEEAEEPPQKPSPVPNGISNGALHTPKHRKSLSAPIKISLSLGNGLSKAPINDIFDLLSAYSYRPIVEEDFRYERNGERAIRVATWNLDRLCLQKAENLGFREVVCRTILENRFSVVAIQDVHDVSALKLLCEELNKPSLRRVSEWKENSRNWNYSLSELEGFLSRSSPGLGFLYDGRVAVPIGAPGARLEAAVARFQVDDIEMALLNACARTPLDFGQVIQRAFAKDEVFLVLGDFTEFTKEIEELGTENDLLNIVPLSTNTSSMSINNHHNHNYSSVSRYGDNILLGGAAKLQYTGVSGVVRQGLTHMAIPRGWSWGGPASEHCPVWCELYVRQITGTCIHVSNEIQIQIKQQLKQNGNSVAIANGNCALKGI